MNLANGRIRGEARLQSLRFSLYCLIRDQRHTLHWSSISKTGEGHLSSKQISAIIVLALGGAYVLWGGKSDHQWDVKNAQQPVTKIIALGDSLTSGHGVPQDQNFVSLVGQQTGIPITNKGQSGDTTGRALSRLKTMALPQAELAIVTLGGNDLLKRSGLDETIKNLGEIFDVFHAKGMMVAYTAIDPPVIGDNWAMAIQQLCKQKGVLYIPAFMKGLWGNSDLMLDKIHPNAKGHAIMAKRVQERIATYLH